MEPVDDDSEHEGEGSTVDEEDSEEDDTRSSSDADDVKGIASKEKEEGFLSALSKETLKPRNKVVVMGVVIGLCSSLLLYEVYIMLDD